MKKWFLYLIFIPIYVLITFFGLGPVLLADGQTDERLITLLAVIGMYVVITMVLHKLLSKV